MSPQSLKRVADEVEVCVETLRNWIKVGVVEAEEVESEQIEQIKQKLTAQGRLASRANKLYTSHDEARCNREGIFYTPEHIVQDMLRTIPKRDIEQMLFLDPCCGSGNFLLAAAEYGFLPHNIYGFDTDAQAIECAKQRVKGAKIVCGDFLEIAPTLGVQFDYIYTNPPWGKRLERSVRERYTKAYSTPRSADTSALFMIASERVLKRGGVLGFLVQEAVFNVGAYEWLRGWMLERRVKSLKDYGRAFKGVISRAQSVIIENTESRKGDVCKCSFDEVEHTRTLDSFASMPKRIMNFWATTLDMEVIARIYSTPHRTLRGVSQWGLGIVTGNNRTLCASSPSKEFELGVVTGGDVCRGEILPPSRFISGELEGFQQCAPRQIYEAPAKLIYRFISKHLIFAPDRSRRYPLNSANCVVVEPSIGVEVEQIAQMLNSGVINWVFERLFRCYKILRTDIESLPLHVGYFDENKEFDEESFCRYIGVERLDNGEYIIKGDF